MEVIGDKKSTRISLDTGPLFFHTVPKPVQALVVTYDETLQALAAEADVLLRKPFTDLDFDGTVRWKSPALGDFLLQFAKPVRWGPS
jgi:hypothetical protein